MSTLDELKHMVQTLMYWASDAVPTCVHDCPLMSETTLAYLNETVPDFTGSTYGYDILAEYLWKQHRITECINIIVKHNRIQMLQDMLQLWSGYSVEPGMVYNQGTQGAQGDIGNTGTQGNGYR